MLMWDMLTGGAPYKEILFRAMHPAFWMQIFCNIFASLLPENDRQEDLESSAQTSVCDESAAIPSEENIMELGALGKTYEPGQYIIRQGEMGDCMYVIQKGLVEILKEVGGQTIQLAILGKGEFFGEMAIFEQESRAATVRALVPARIITIDQKNLLRRIQEDPSLAYRLVQVMSNRIRKLGEEFTMDKNLPFQAPLNSTRSHFDVPTKGLAA